MRLKVQVEWPPRSGNAEADALANGSILRLGITIHHESLSWDLLPRALDMGRFPTEANGRGSENPKNETNGAWCAISPRCSSCLLFGFHIPFLPSLLLSNPTHTTSTAINSTPRLRAVYRVAGWHWPFGPPPKLGMGPLFSVATEPFGRFGSPISEHGLPEMSPFSWFGCPSGVKKNESLKVRKIMFKHPMGRPKMQVG